MKGGCRALSRRYRPEAERFTLRVRRNRIELKDHNRLRVNACDERASDSLRGAVRNIEIDFQPIHEINGIFMTAIEPLTMLALR